MMGKRGIKIRMDYGGDVVKNVMETVLNRGR